MKEVRVIEPILIVLLLLFAGNLLIACGGDPANAQETIVAIRHAEKPLGGLGQLDCQGLNRALALPRVLISRFGKPAAIYAPDPSMEVNDGANHQYSYVRPLMTIEPTAIVLGMPVNAQIGYKKIDELQTAVTDPSYGHSLIFIAWEHVMLNLFAKQVVQTYGLDPSMVPDWPEGDYDRIYIFKLQTGNGKPQLTFDVSKEALNGTLSSTCPTASVP